MGMADMSGDEPMPAGKATQASMTGYTIT